jgi:hypothetical protein
MKKESRTKTAAETQLGSSQENGELSVETLAEIEALFQDEGEQARIALTLTQAALVLGKSQRALERSLTGKWGNKLPEGWDARKVRSNGRDEWRIIPPAGFKFKFSNELTEEVSTAPERVWDQLSDQAVSKPSRHIAKRLELDTFDHHTIVIDRTDEVEYLLREVVSAHKALAEERRVHLEDVRLLSQLQSSMRLLEVNSAETARLKEDLLDAQRDLVRLRKEYLDFLSLPWWKRLLRHFPKI